MFLPEPDSSVRSHPSRCHLSSCEYPHAALVGVCRCEKPRLLPPIPGFLPLASPLLLVVESGDESLKNSNKKSGLYPLQGKIFFQEAQRRIEFCPLL